MGAGKSTAGRRLARILALPFFDSDAEIVREHGEIASIFESEGEERFREYEAAVIDRLSLPGACVIAVGGGAVVDPRNRAALRRDGVIVHLAMSPETSFRRVAHRSHRPLLGPAPTLGAIRTMMQSRASAYADNDLSIAVDTKSSVAVANIIARWYRRREAAASARA